MAGDPVTESHCEERRDNLIVLIEQRIAHEHEMVEQRFTLQQKALDLTAAELARRLEILNHAHERAEAERGKVVSRELYDQFRKDFEEFRLETGKQLARIFTWGAAGGVALTILSLVLRFLKW